MAIQKNTLIVTVLMLLLNTYAWAETQYIQDELYVPIRSGPGTQYRILHKGLKSGTPLELINAEEESSVWTKIKTTNGLEGWIRSQYLQVAPTSALKLKQAQSELSALKERSKRQEKRLSELEKQLATSNQDLSSNQKDKQEISLELHRIKSISSGAIELDLKYQNLLETHELLQTENDTLMAENTNLRADRRFSYMVYGAGLMLLGMLVSVILPRLRFKKRNSEWVN